MVPCMPTCCPVGAIGGGEACSISAHHWRNRKTGPPFALLVARCRIHGCAFTLYPPGFAPYRRQTLLRVSPQGEPILGVGRSSPEVLSSTLFEAAADSCRGRPWARDSGDEEDLPERWWGTQGRHLKLAAALVGVARSLSAKVRESIATMLSVPALMLYERSRSRGYRAIGCCVCEVLERLLTRGRRVFALLVCGHLIGHWGEPLWWDAHRGLVERSPFCATGTTAMT